MQREGLHAAFFFENKPGQVVFEKIQDPAPGILWQFMAI